MCITISCFTRLPDRYLTLATTYPHVKKIKMGTTHFGVLPIFDHNQHAWKTYKARITQWFLANDVNVTTDAAAVKRRAILLSTLSDGTYKLAADLALPKDLQQVPYLDILKLLEDHFVPKVVGFGERYKFYSAVQQQGETHAQWAARLRGLTAECDFLNVEEALRDRFIMGLLAGPERDKLFSLNYKELTLAKAVEDATAVRCARDNAAAAAQAQGASQEPVFKIVQRASSENKEREKCAVCGYSNHKTSDCRFANYKCKKCQVKGHLKRMCKSVKYMEANPVNEGDDGKLFNIRSEHGEPMSQWVTILGVSIKFEIDSGSAITAMSEQMFKKHYNSVSLVAANKKLVSYTGDNIECIGMAPLPVSYAGRTQLIDVYIIRNGGPPILGRDFISLFKLEITSVQYCTQNQDEYEKLQKRYPSVFSDKLGLFTKYKVELQLKQDAKPVFFKARPIAFALKNKVDRELDRLVNLGVLKPVEYSEFASPIVPVLKNNGSVRICADYSVTINKQLVVEQYPLPTIKELFSKLHGGQHFTKLDLSSAYTQLELKPESQNMTCINTHRGLFNYTRLVFGLASAPAIFQRAIDSLLSGMEGILCLLDDILITGKDKDEHLQRLNAVLERLKSAGFTLQKEKCVFFQDQVSYLGYIIDKHGLHKSPDKVKAILDAPVPTNVSKLQSFLGLINYYRNFVQGTSAILSPMYDLLKKGEKWCWTDKHNEAFRKIKECLASEQVLAHYDPNARLILTVDASPYGLGCILSQIQADSCERPISFASRTLNAAEKQYSQIQKEATAIIFGVRRYHQYLYGRSDPFILRTDHKPLISIFGPHKGIPEVSANRLQRYALFLSAYNYKIEFIRSAVNSADFLSRACLPEQGCDGEPSRSGLTDDRASYMNFVIEGCLPITTEELRNETNKDAILSKVVTYTCNGWPKKIKDDNIRPFFQCRSQLAFENGCLMRGHKVVIPATLWARALAELHNSHLGIVKTKAEARSKFWFPNVDKEIEKMIGSCETCIKLRPTPGRAPLVPWKFPSKPFTRIHLDFLGPINNSTYLVIVDAHTKWVEAYNMKSGTSSPVVIEKLHEFMARFGLPKIIGSDNGCAFTSQEFKNFCLLNGITHVTSPAYYPASNGQAESFIKIIKKGIKSCLMNSRGVKDCNNRLQKYLFDYRNSIHSTTGCSPAQLVFGRKLRTRLDIIDPLTPSPSSMELAQYVKKKQCLQSEIYSGQNHTSFEVNDKVLYKKNFNNNKYTWCKGIICNKVGKVIYLVRDCENWEIYKRHKNQLLKYKGHEKIVPAPESYLTDWFLPPPLGSSSVQEKNEEKDNGKESDQGETSQNEILTAAPAAAAATNHSPLHEEFADAQSEEPSGEETEERSDESTSNRPKRNRPPVSYKQYF